MARKSRKDRPRETEAPKTPVCVAIGYARISKEGEKSEDSMENQAAIIKDYVKDKPDIDLRKVIVSDSGYTGTNFDRPGCAELMDLIKIGAAGCVIVKDLSRLGRDYIEVGELLFDTFLTLGIRFISVNDRYDSFADDAGRKKLLILFKNLVNHMYSRDLGKKIRSVKALKQKNGERTGGLPPYGYAMSGDGKTYVIDPEAAETVRLIFDMRRNGRGTFNIANHLNAVGVPSPRNYYHGKGLVTSERFASKIRWRHVLVYAILTNGQYTGRLIQGKTRVCGKTVTETPREDWIVHDNAFPAVIDAELFDEVQKIISADNGKRRRGAGKDGETRAADWGENILVGKIYCARCGKSAPRLEQRKKTGLAYSYLCYFCNAELRGTGVKAGHFTTPFAAIEEAVASAVRNLIAVCAETREPTHEKTNTGTHTDERRALTRETNRRAAECEHAERLLTAAYEHRLDGLLDAEEFECARKKFETDRAAATANLERAENALRDFDAAAARRNAALSNARKYGGFVELTREIVNAFVYRIEISPTDDGISVSLNFTDCFYNAGTPDSESGVIVDV
jgi:DNA invertase Pin-like site-specific DNA recombinase